MDVVSKLGLLKDISMPRTGKIAVFVIILIIIFIILWQMLPGNSLWPWSCKNLGGSPFDAMRLFVSPMTMGLTFLCPQTKNKLESKLDDIKNAKCDSDSK